MCSSDLNEVLDLREMSQGAKLAAKNVVKIKIPQDMENGLEQIKEVLSQNRGETPVLIYLGNTGKAMKTKPDLWVNADSAFRQQVTALIGEENLKL